MNFGDKNLWLIFFPNGSLPSHTQYGLSFQIFVFSQGRHAAYFKSNSQCLAEHHTLRHLQNFQKSQKLILYNATELINKCSLCPICIKFFLGHQFKKVINVFQTLLQMPFISPALLLWMIAYSQFQAASLL